MTQHAASLFEFVGIVLPISFIGLRILLDEIEDVGGVPREARANAVMNHAAAMVTLLVAAGWFAVLEVVVAPSGVPLVALGYVAAAAGITVPAWLLVSLRRAFDAAAFGNGAGQ